MALQRALVGVRMRLVQFQLVSVPNSRFVVRGAWFVALDSQFLVCGLWCSVPGFLVFGSWVVGGSARFLVRGS